MIIKSKILRFLRKKCFQLLWWQLYKLTIIAQNYWSTSVEETGEIKALELVSKMVMDDQNFIVMDVGANIGQFAFVAVEELKPSRIYSFEPSLFAYECLEKKIAVNNLVNIIVPQPYALSDNEGK